MTKLLSISIAAYNVENYLKEALDSFVIPELYDKLEILIVDDGSTDKTADIAEEYCNKYPALFKHIRKENGGWGSTVNTGIQNSTGKYFKQLDGDDFFEIKGLKSFVNSLESIDSDAVLTKFITFRDVSKEIYNEFKFDEGLNMATEYNFEDIIEKLGNLAMHNLTVKTTILQDNYSDLKLTEHCFYTDVEYLLKTSNYLNSVTILPVSVYWYRIGRDGQSVSISGICKHYEEHLTVLKNLLIYMDTKIDNSKVKDFFANRLTTMACVQYERYLCLPISKNSKKEMVEFDVWIRKHYPLIDVQIWKKIKILRATNFLVYPLMSKYVRKQIQSIN